MLRFAVLIAWLKVEYGSRPTGEKTLTRHGSMPFALNNQQIVEMLWQTDPFNENLPAKGAQS